MCNCRGTVLLGFEQSNRYAVYDEKGEIVAQIAEDDSLAIGIRRQLLGSRRPFTATVFSADGAQQLFYPVHIISSSRFIHREAP